MIKNMQKSRFAKNIHDLSLLEKWADMWLVLAVCTNDSPLGTGLILGTTLWLGAILERILVAKRPAAAVFIESLLP